MVEVSVWRVGGNSTRGAVPYRVRVSASKERGALDALLRNSAGSFSFSFCYAMQFFDHFLFFQLRLVMRRMRAMRMQANIEHSTIRVSHSTTLPRFRNKMIHRFDGLIHNKKCSWWMVRHCSLRHERTAGIGHRTMLDSRYSCFVDDWLIFTGVFSEHCELYRKQLIILRIRNSNSKRFQFIQLIMQFSAVFCNCCLIFVLFP